MRIMQSLSDPTLCLYGKRVISFLFQLFINLLGTSPHLKITYFSCMLSAHPWLKVPNRIYMPCAFTAIRGLATGIKYARLTVVGEKVFTHVWGRVGFQGCNHH